MAALSLHCCAWTFLSIESRGYSSCSARASHCSGFSCWGAWALGAQASVAAACGLSCYLACGIFPNQGSNMCPLHWQADSQSLECQGNPHTCFFFFNELLLSTYYVSRPVLGIEGKRWTTQSSTGAALREWVCICTISPGGFWELGKAFYLDECNMSTSGWQIYYWRQNILSCKDLWMFSKQEAFSPNWTEFSSVQLLSPVRLFATPWIAACQASLSITNSWSPPKPMSIELVMPSSHLILCRPLLLLPPVLPSIRVFSHESTLHMRWPKCWSFSFNISPSNEHPGLISFRMDWLDLLAVQGTLKNLLQHHSSKASILWCSAFFLFFLNHFKTFYYIMTENTVRIV